MQANETLGALWHSIDQMQQELFQYRNRPTYNISIAQSKQQRINQLTKIHDTLVSAGNLTVWAELNTSIKNMKAQDPSMKALLLDLGPSPNHVKRGSLYLPLNI